MNPCSHEWFMCHIRHGYLVVEGCFECGGRLSFFSDEPVPPVDEYRQGRHFWNYMGSFQTVKFDLQCRRCGTTISLEDVNGIMFSECQDRDCQVGALVAQQGPGSLVYVALCPDSTHAAGPCVSKEGIEALTQYFNQDLGALGRKVIVVPCKLCNSIDRCRGTVIADVGLTDIQ
jgi:hypothetical protein